MPTAAAPRGSNAVALWKQETTYGTAPSGNYTRLPFYADNLDEKQPWDNDQLLGLSLQNARDASDPSPGLPNAGGQVEWPLDLAFAGFPLNQVLGAPATSGAGSDYVHVFSSGLDVIPHWSREIKLGASLYSLATGIIGKKLTISAGRKAGYDRLTVDYLGRKVVKATSTGGGTPAAMLARVPVLAAIPVFKLDSVVVGDVMAVDLTYDNGVVEQDYLGDAAGYPLGHDTDDEPTCTGSIRVRLRGTGLWDQAKQLPATVDSALGELLWYNSAARSLSLSMASMWIEPFGTPIKGKGRIEQTFNFRCSQTASVAMLVATLKSPTATFP